MLVEEIIGGVLLRVTGGRPTSDSSVQPDDVKVYIPDAVNGLMGVRIGEEYGIDQSVYPNGLFVNFYDDIPVQTNSRNLKYIEFPVRPLTVVKAKSVVSVGPVGGRPFTRIYHDEGTLGSFYWKSRTDVTSFDVEGNTAVFYNIPSTVGNCYAKLVVHIDSLDYDDEIFVPSGMETQLIEEVYRIMMTQKMGMKDDIIDGRDNQS